MLSDDEGTWLRVGPGAGASNCSTEVDARRGLNPPRDETDSLRLLLIGDERAYGAKRALLSEVDEAERFMAGAGVAGSPRLLCAAADAAAAAAAALALAACTLSADVALVVMERLLFCSRLARAC